MARTGFVSRFLKVCALAAFLTVLTDCGVGGDSGPQPVSLAISGTPTASLAQGQSAQLTATLTYSDASVKDVTTTATWSTTNASVLSVSSFGTILAVAPGQADVVASTQGLSSRATVSVAPVTPNPTSLAISGIPTASMLPGQSAQLVATLTYSDGSTADVTASTIWASTATNVLSVSSSGAIVAIATGQADVSASAQGLSSRVTVLVGPPAPQLALFAGNLDAAGPGSADGPGPAAQFYVPSGVAVDGVGNVYVADRFNYTVRKITPAGVVTTFVGSAGSSGSADGTGAEARFTDPTDVATDGTGNVYVADGYSVRKISPTGVVTTLVAGGSTGTYFRPRSVAVDGAGNVYVADLEHYTISKISAAGVFTALAGNGQQGSADGPGADARFSSPRDVAVDSAGNVYVTDGSTIRKINPAGIVTTLAGSAGMYGFVDGTGADARFSGLAGAAVDGAGNIYVIASNAIRKITATGTVTTLVPIYLPSDFISSCYGPVFGDLAIDRAGNFIVSDDQNNTILRITPDAVVSIIAGTARTWGYKDGVAEQARFGNCVPNPAKSIIRNFVGPRYAAADSAGNVYVADAGNAAVRKISPTGVVTTLAGGSTGTFVFPTGVTVDGAGNVYVADCPIARYQNVPQDWGKIFKISPGGVVSTLAGGSETGSIDPPLYCPYGIAIDSAGSLYVADGSAVRKITPAGVVTTFAGSYASLGSADGPGADARFDGASGVAVDGAGNVYVADTYNYTVRKISTAGVVTTLAGSAKVSGSADGIGAEAQFAAPLNVATDSAGNVYVVDAGNYTIRKIIPAGVVSTVVGVAGRKGFVPGALPGGLSNPRGVAISGTSLYITMDSGVGVVTNVP